MAQDWELTPQEVYEDPSIEEWDDCARCGRSGARNTMQVRPYGKRDPQTGQQNFELICPICMAADIEDREGASADAGAGAGVGAQGVDILDIAKAHMENGECVPF